MLRRVRVRPGKPLVCKHVPQSDTLHALQVPAQGVHSISRKQSPLSKPPGTALMQACSIPALARGCESAGKAESTRLLRCWLLVLDFGGPRQADFGVPLGGAAYAAHGAWQHRAAPGAPGLGTQRGPRVNSSVPANASQAQLCVSASPPSVQVPHGGKHRHSSLPSLESLCARTCLGPTRYDFTMSVW
jgi:hypothetical protein